MYGKVWDLDLISVKSRKNRGQSASPRELKDDSPKQGAHH